MTASQPKIELRKISYNSRLSEETSAYAAQIWANGVHICDVSNHGQGGPDEHTPAKGRTRGDINALNVLIKNTFPQWELGGSKHDTDLEIVCGNLLNEHLMLKELRRACVKKFLWAKSDGVYQVKKVPGRETEQLKAIKARHNVVTLNEMEDTAALAAYRSFAI